MFHGVFQAHSQGNRISLSGDAPQSVTAWWRLVLGLLASGLQHGINKSFSLITVLCAVKRDMVPRGNTVTEIPDKPPKTTFGRRGVFTCVALQKKGV